MLQRLPLTRVYEVLKWGKEWERESGKGGGEAGERKRKKKFSFHSTPVFALHPHIQHSSKLFIKTRKKHHHLMCHLHPLHLLFSLLIIIIKRLLFCSESVSLLRFAFNLTKRLMLARLEWERERVCGILCYCWYHQTNECVCVCDNMH